MEVFIIKKQSESDVITNSSSEVFIMHTDKNLEEISNILHSFTYGFQEPIRFDLEAYKKALKEKRKREREGKENDSEYWNIWGYSTPYSIAEDNFIDFSDEYEITRKVLNELWFIGGYCDNLPKKFEEYFGYPPEEYIKFLLSGEEDKLNSAKQWIKSVTGKDPKEILTCRELYYELHDLEELDGAIMVISKSDNSIPYEDFDKIDSLFNAYHIHLG